MKAILNVILAWAISMIIQDAGATYKTWQFWATVVLLCAIVMVQYIPC